METPSLNNILERLEARPYQLSLAEQIGSDLQNYFILLPKGTGKTYIPVMSFYYARDQGIIPEDAKGIIVVPQQSMKWQWLDMIEKVGVKDSKKKHGFEEGVKVLTPGRWQDYRAAAGRRNNETYSDSEVEGWQKYMWPDQKDQDGITLLARNIFSHDIDQITWLITTPKTLANDLSYIHPDVLKKFKYIIFDEVQNLASITDIFEKDVVPAEEIVADHRTNLNYRIVINEFVKKFKPKVIGLTGGFKNSSRQVALEALLEATSITASEEDVQPFVGTIGRHFVEVDDEYSSKIYKLVDNIQKKCVRYIVRNAERVHGVEIDPRKANFWNNVISLIYKEPGKGGEFSLRDRAIAFLMMDLVKRNLYDAVHFETIYNCFKKLDARTLPTSIKIDPENNWEEIMSIIEEQRQSIELGKCDPWSAKVRALEELINAENISTDCTTNKNMSITFDDKTESKARYPNIKDQQIIVFTKFKKTARQLARILQRKKIPALFVTGELSDTAKNERRELFKNGDYQVIVATYAIYGEAMDLPNANACIAFNYPYGPDADQMEKRIRFGDVYYLHIDGTEQRERLEVGFERLKEERLKIRKVRVGKDEKDKELEGVEELLHDLEDDN